MKQDSEYYAWVNMRQRCRNPNHPEYFRYGGRGITVDPAWDTYIQFLADVGRKPAKEHSLERVDNSLGYSKDNCVWATKSQQSYNQRKASDNKSGVVGVCREKQTNKWKAFIRFEGKQITLGRFEDFSEACDARKAAEVMYYGEKKCLKQN